MRDILAHASNHAAPTRSMRYAAETAKIFDASLTGIFVSEPIMPLSPLDIPLVPEIYGAAGQITGEAMAYEPKFHQWASAAGVMRHKWRVASAFFTAALASAANWHDVLVLESGGNAPWASVPMLGHALVTCGVPCFVVPESYARPAAFDSIVIASHGSPESIRAAHAALPLLKRAKRILLIQDKQDDAFSTVDFRPAFSLQGHLQRHGLQFTTQTLDESGEHVGAKILAASEAADADVLVMGAYGRTRFSEWILGGATRHVLDKARLPVFMRH